MTQMTHLSHVIMGKKYPVMFFVTVTLRATRSGGEGGEAEWEGGCTFRCWPGAEEDAIRLSRELRSEGCGRLLLRQRLLRREDYR
jgi:hypothetical protein